MHTCTHTHLRCTLAKSTHVRHTEEYKSSSGHQGARPITTVHLIVTLVYCNARDAVVTDTRTATRRPSSSTVTRRRRPDEQRCLLPAGRRAGCVIVGRPSRRSSSLWSNRPVGFRGCWHDRRRTDRGASTGVRCYGWRVGVMPVSPSCVYRSAFSSVVRRRLAADRPKSCTAMRALERGRR